MSDQARRQVSVGCGRRRRIRQQRRHAVSAARAFGALPRRRRPKFWRRPSPKSIVFRDARRQICPDRAAAKIDFKRIRPSKRYGGGPFRARRACAASQAVRRRDRLPESQAMTAAVTLALKAAFDFAALSLSHRAGAGERQDQQPLDDWETSEPIELLFCGVRPPTTQLLLTLARGEEDFSDPTVLDAQVKRMLASPKAAALADGFLGPVAPGARSLHQPPPDPIPASFPRSRPACSDAHVRRTHALLHRSARKPQRSASRDLLDANYTYLR